VVKWKETDKMATQAVRKPVFAKAARLVHVLKTGWEFYRRQSLDNRQFFRPTDRE
jgi:hypothetical protein